MKAFSIVALLVLSFFAHATQQLQQPYSYMEVADKAQYVCKAYTNNKAEKADATSPIKIVGESPVVEAETKIDQTPEGFTIRSGKAFAQEKVLTNSQMGSASGMAGDPTTLIVKKEEVPGVVYFVVYQFEAPDSPKAVNGIGPIKGLMHIAKCEEKD